MTRRELLASTCASIACSVVPGAFATTGQDLDFVSALDAAAAIKAKKVSSVELTRRIFARIDKYNPKLNAFAYQMREQALAQARQADEAVARRESLGVFHGVPFAVKESFAVEGEPDTWGIPQFKNSKATANSAVVERLLKAGAIVTGGTNVPLNLMDWQTFNDIYGTTNNPWDLTRTPGGSSGGTAAALAAGLTYLSVGSDIGGSIRVPAHFCGIYGHKPTLDLVSMRGHTPGGQPGLHGFSTGLAVAGPMARSARDLVAALHILGGPDGYDRKAWSWTLPPPRRRSLKDFRVGFVLDSPLAPRHRTSKPCWTARLPRSSVRARNSGLAGRQSTSWKRRLTITCFFSRPSHLARSLGISRSATVSGTWVINLHSARVRSALMPIGSGSISGNSPIAISGNAISSKSTFS